jgi:hypothetical protein
MLIKENNILFCRGPLLFGELRWEVVVSFTDIGGIVKMRGGC